MVQLVFDASTAEEALERTPSRSATASTRARSGPTGATTSSSSSTGRTRSSTRPTARTRTSTARRSTSAARPRKASAATTRAGRRSTSGRPCGRSRASATTARADYPWIAFEGRWGELRPAFFNGPTGPNLKEQWTHPITWSENWRDRAATPSPEAASSATARRASSAARSRTGRDRSSSSSANPVEFTLVLGALVLLLLFLLSRTTWRPAAPLRLAHRRSWGQILSASARMYAALRPLRRDGRAVRTDPLLVSLLQALVLHATSVLGVQSAGGSEAACSATWPRDRDVAHAARGSGS